MPKHSSFETARQSVEWSYSAISDIGDIARSYFGNPDNIEHPLSTDVRTGESVLSIRLVNPLPADIRRRATEALVNARHSFDQATYAACSILSKSKVKSIYYPWSQNQIDLEKLLVARKIPESLHATYHDHQPYKQDLPDGPGNTLIRNLATLANNKHTVGIETAADIASISHGQITGEGISSLSILIPRWNPQTREAELIRFKADHLKIAERPSGSFRLMFKDENIPKNVTAIVALRQFADQANRVIDTLETAALGG